MVDQEEFHTKKGFGLKISYTIIVAIGWLVFLLLWLFFYAGEFGGWYKNFAVFLLSLLVLVILLGLPWMLWGFRFQSAEEKEMWMTKGFKGRVVLSVVFVFIFMLFLIYWFWMMAESYDIFQNIAIFIVSILIFGGIIGLAWAPWRKNYCPRCKKNS